MTVRPKLLLLSIFFCLAVVGFAESRPVWDVQAGAYVTQIRRSGSPPVGLYLQAASPAVLCNIQIAMQLETEQWGDSYLATGFQIPFQITEWLGIAGVSTFGYYHKGSRFDLGGPWIFRNGMDIVIGKVGTPGRLVIGYSHHSSAGLSQPNSGKESFRVGWVIQI